VTPILEITDLGYRYPDGTGALDGVTFQIDLNERVALLGPTGAGKSTLLLHLNGLLKPSTGSVTVDSVPISDDTLREVRTRVGLVFQDPDDQLFLPTLLEDVAFAPLNEGRDPEEAVGRAREVLGELGLLGNEERAAHHLSGGQKRLAALATVLVSRPAVLALDEPTGNLDARGRRTLVRLLGEREETLMVATHDLEVARALCTRALVLESGKLVADRPVAEILADGDFLRRQGLSAPLKGEIT
jgi:cobalt/nickel transport system ATP-binding protein